MCFVLFPYGVPGQVWYLIVSIPDIWLLLYFNDNNYHEGNISKMPNFDIFSLLECKKRYVRSHGIQKNGNIKRKICAEKRINTSLKHISVVFKLSSLTWFTFIFKFFAYFDVILRKRLINNKKYDTALLTKCYVQHFISPYIE